mmetsp:Transcript_36303/g.72198  ORF Transcript_36303/g.72198 Transcript_36303/m.72198 type:complete len:202 (+) Transcript_36303:1981-2586(+)
MVAKSPTTSTAASSIHTASRGSSSGAFRLTSPSLRVTTSTTSRPPTRTSRYIASSSPSCRWWMTRRSSASTGTPTSLTAPRRPRRRSARSSTSSLRRVAAAAASPARRLCSTWLATLRPRCRPTTTPRRPRWASRHSAGSASRSTSASSRRSIGCRWCSSRCATSSRISSSLLRAPSSCRPSSPTRSMRSSTPRCPRRGPR